MFTTRLATAIVLLAVCVTALFFLPNRWWTAVLVPVLLAASWEWSALAGLRSAARWAYMGFMLASGAALWLLAAGTPGSARWHAATDAAVYGVAGIFWVVVAPAWLALRWRARALALAATGWVVIVPAWLALSRLQSDPRFLLTILGVIWLADTAAYVVGRRWGRRKLAPRISPGKTWEGLAGAGAAVAVYYVALLIAASGGWASAGGAVLFGAVAVMGVVGDLFESWVKRQAAVKDSGGLLPGHGGILDRIDSMTAALPIAALLLPFAI
jgi:phosphatidate cytidylyltransferase